MSKMKRLPKIVHGFYSLTISPNLLMLDVWQGYECASEKLTKRF